MLLASTRKPPRGWIFRCIGKIADNDKPPVRADRPTGGSILLGLHPTIKTTVCRVDRQ